MLAGFSFSPGVMDMFMSCAFEQFKYRLPDPWVCCRLVSLHEAWTVKDCPVFREDSGLYIRKRAGHRFPFLHSGVVTENKWLSERTVLDAVAVAMITPGPVVITTRILSAT